ncbi:cell division protein FtsK [Idiomarina sp. OT37-5b]|jgi:S-DNA-T family DNA segregation ATPase FtsK/SpoIIIE|uniref:DNA translocase FtsK n=1 Tax=Idiomarina aquatica TaxID=1327752 RepID=A0AA94JEE7_9GAMM|nr:MULTISPECIES: DNA translocase FtsK [Idiomarina]AVJ55826.1 cell division protein FtsK [Idiomarina sp. OT37-5b]RUO44566.1 cell division protein FtsK [Idiomarina aquatica]
MTGVQRLLEAGLLISGALAIFIFLSLVSFNPADPSWSQTGFEGAIHNAGGAVGAWTADVLLFTFGFVAYLIPFAFAGLGYLLFRQTHRLLELDYLAVSLRLVGALLTLIGASALSSINFDDIYYFSAGGIFGDVIASSLLPYLNFVGSTLLLLTFLATGLTLVTGISWLQVADKLGEWSINGVLWLVEKIRTTWTQRGDSEPQQQTEQPSQRAEPDDSVLAIESDEQGRADEPKIDLEGLFGKNEHADDKAEPTLDLPSINPLAEDEPEPPRFSKQAAERKQQVSQPSSTALTVSEKATAQSDDNEQAETLPPLPSIELLDRPNKKENPITQEELDQVSRTVETVLKDFGVDVTVAHVQPGPVITRFELDLAPGVKVSKISNLAKDIARTLSAVAVRVVEVIPGKSYVGLELPNKHREIVQLSEVINCDAFQNSTSPLTMILGKNIAGGSVVVDLAKMPHLLVAGTTGSGKSVGVNVMILSLLYKSTPEDVRLIMIDPKMLELSVYEGIPHLLTEVVTDMKDAANALRWCVGEMERRYKLMSALGVRNLKGYNAKVAAAKAEGKPLRDPIWKPGDSMDELPPELDKLPNIVVVIDEFADMMMIVGKKVEELIARIAQKARAAGIHLILATQRPSVDVITGLIKANIPTRIAFQVSSKVDSRTILDQPGADQLLGQGDMLYLPPGSGSPVRVHGAFVDDHEVHAVVADWKKRGKPNYLDEILSGDQGEDALLPGEQSEDEDGESDPLYDEAVAFVTESQRVSVSSVQRKFRIGYNRAARIVEQMEMSGVVSTAGNNGQRDVLAPPPVR